MSHLPAPLETIGELRQLYRAAESRAARLRLLSRSGRDLATADPATLDAALGKAAVRLANFLGETSAQVSHAVDPASGLPLPAPGRPGEAIAYLRLKGVGVLEDIADAEDRETVRLQLELMGLTIDRIEREAERSRLMIALREREQQLEFVVERLFSAQEEERRRVSHDLHDGVAQTATALVRLLEGQVGPDDGRLAQIARGLVTELRGVIGGLRPPLLDDLGLEAALHHLAEELRSDGFTVQVAVSGTRGRWPANAETALFRVAQEATTNIRKHAGGPCRVEITLLPGDATRPLRLTIRDHGIGCVEELKRPRSADGNEVGIAVMRERMAALGGELSWSAVPGSGVTVIASLPGSAS